MVREGEDSITDDEIILRRIPVNSEFYDPVANTLSPSAFSPHKDRDKSGLSVARAKYTSVEDEAARGTPGKQYYIASFSAAVLRNAGILIVPKPHLADGKFSPSHAELPQLNAASKKDSETLSRQKFISDHLIRVDGPFLSPG